MTGGGVLYVVVTPIGNLSDVTARAEEVLRTVEVVYAEDTRRTGRLLKEVGASPRLRSLHEHNEARRAEELVDVLEAGTNCALVADAGAPVVSDPGRRAVEAVAGAGLRVIPVPGPSAVTAAVMVSGLPGDRFAFLGFPPRSGSDRERWMELCTSLPVTVVVFESPERVGDLMQALARRGLGERRCAVCRELTKLHEEVIRGTVAEVASRLVADTPRGEVTVVLAGRERGGWEERREEARERARELQATGHSTREISDALQREYDVPRNEAYQLGLDVSDDDWSREDG